ncbi:MAG: ABC transporter permease, partial [Vulcanimicrobiaceae bacterium]
MKFLGTAGQFVAEAGEVLLANRTRSALTIVGLVVGVAAVIAIEIAGAGMAGAVTGILGSLSDQSFFVFPDARQADPGRASVPLSALPRLVQRFPQIVAAIPAEDVERLVSAGNARARLQIGADTNVAYATVPLVYGRQISAADVASGAHVAVLTHDAYAHLFPPGDDPVGASIRIGDAR